MTTGIGFNGETGGFGLPIPADDPRLAVSR